MYALPVPMLLWPEGFEKAPRAPTVEAQAHHGRAAHETRLARQLAAWDDGEEELRLQDDASALQAKALLLDSGGELRR